MATKTPETISAVLRTRQISSSVFTEVGGVLIALNDYPNIKKVVAVAAAKQTGGGVGTLRIWDYLGTVELGEITFTSTSLEVKSSQLNDLPVIDEDGFAYIEFELKNVGGSNCKIYRAMLEFC